ncbi:MAG: LamG domain-containing protein [bacterium]
MIGHLRNTFSALKYFGIIFLVMVMIFRSTEILSQSSPISLHADNNHYFNFRGEPTILITSGEFYSAVQNLDFDYIPYLDELEENGLNYTRLFNGSFVDGMPEDLPIMNGNDVMIPVGSPLFPDAINAEKTKGLIAPWARSSEPGYAGGGNKFDLDTWDTEYFDRLKDFVEEAGNRGIVVELTFFCGYSEDYYWSLSPLNYQNNVNNVGKFGGDYGPYDGNGNNIGHMYPLTMASEADGLLVYLEDVVEKTIDELSVYDNVFFEIANEPYYTDAGNTVINQNGEHCGNGHGVSSEWQAHMAQIVIDKVATLDNDYLIAQNIDAYFETVEVISSNTSPSNVDDFRMIYPEIDIVNFHYAARIPLYTTASVDYNYDLNRPIGCDENGGTGYTDEKYRKQAWNYIIAGGGIFNNLDMSFTVDGYEGGQPTNPSQGFGGSPEYRQQLGILKEFIHDLNFLQMEPHNDLPASGGIITNVSPSDILVRCLANEGEEYAVYVEGGSVVYITFNLPAGTYTAEWINTKERDANGQLIVEKTVTFTHNGGSKSLGSPNYAEGDIALRILNDYIPPESETGDKAYWKFDEGSGNTTLDHSTNTNNGNLINNPAWVTGVSGTALDLDGIEDYLDCGTDGSMDIGTGDFTLSAWINMGSDQEVYPTIVAKGAGSNTSAGYWFIATGNKLSLLFSNGSSRITLNSSSVGYADNNWHHVAASIDRSNNVTFYLDAVNIGEVDVSQFNGQNIVSSNSLTVGSWQTSATSFFDGKIDEIKLIGDALTQSEITALFNASDDPPPDPDPDPDPDPNAMAQWTMEEGQGTTTADVTGNGNDGVLEGSPNWVGGYTGNAINFDGVNDRINCGPENGTDMGTGDFTITGWIKMGSSQNTYPTVVSKGAGSSSDEGYWLIVRYSRLWLFLSNGVTRMTLSSDISEFNDNTWHHVAASIDRSGDVSFYLDTIPIGTADVSQFNGQNISSTDEFVIGAWKTNSSSYMRGVMDDIRLFPAALTAGDIAAVYSGGGTPVPSPSAFWEHDEGGGTTTADASGNGNNGTLINGTAWTTGISGNAVLFDGNNDRIDYGSNSDMDIETGDFTIAGWVKMGSAQKDNPTLVAKGAGADYDTGYWLYWNNGSLRMYLSDGNARLAIDSDPVTIADNSWHHVAAVLDRNGDMTFYVDGVASGSADISAHEGKNLSSTKSFTAGSWQTSAQSYLDGVLDDLRIYKLALSESQVIYLHDLYAANKSVEMSYQDPDYTEIEVNIYPNPSKGQLNFELNVQNEAKYQIHLYDMNGQMLAQIENRRLTAGQHLISWQAQALGGRTIEPGLYFVRISGPASVVTRSIVILE